MLERLREQARRKRVEREAPFAVLAAAVLVESGLNPFKAFELLGDLDSLPAVAEEVKRIRAESLVGMRTLPEQLSHEARGTRGVWGRLLSTLVSVDRLGLDPKRSLRDLLYTILRDMRTEYESTARRFTSMISSASVLFGALPMMFAVIFALMASHTVLQYCLGFTILNAFLAVTWLLAVEAQVPEVADYRVGYKRILVKWLPLGIAVGSALYYGLLQLPQGLVYSTALPLAAGALAFSLPAYIEWRLYSRTVDEVVEDLPRVLRDVADEVARGYSPHQALENIAEGYGGYTGRLLSLIIKEARVCGGLREAYTRLKNILPKPWRISLELLALTEEAGGGAGALNTLADTMLEYTLMIRELRRSTQIYRVLSLGFTAMTLALLSFLFNTVVVAVAAAGRAAQMAPTALPFSPVPPEDLPLFKDAVYTMVAASSVFLALVTGKTTEWRIGGSLLDLALTSIILLAFLLLRL